MKARPASRDEPAPGREAGVRLDKWLWAARFYKTRALACEAVERGRVKVNDADAKPGRSLRCGDRVALRQGDCPLPRIVTVQALSEVRGPAPVAQQLYLDDPAAQAAIAQWSAQRRYVADPAQAIEHGRPTKSDRRQLAQWQRWSASIDDDPA